jgi:thiamine kinase-like enzyme
MKLEFVLAKITTYQFLKSGFFDKDLNITDELADNFSLTLAKKYLQNQQVISMLGTEIILKIMNCLDKYGDLFLHKDEKHLVHGDFDPANILVEQTNGVWKVSGILDWEFAFSGSTLCDVASMLRYAHKMPPEFKNAFLSGLTSGGIILPENWRISIHLLNLLSLLEILRRSDHQNSPNQSNDIRELINYILSE